VTWPQTKQIETEDSYVVLARVGRPHGVRGMLHVDLTGDHLRDFVGENVTLCRAAQFRQVIAHPQIIKSLMLEKTEPAHGEVKSVGFAGIADRDSAAQLTNLLIVQPFALMRQKARAQHGSQHVPFADLWYFEMYGLSVVDSGSKKPIGVISQIEDLGKNTLVTIQLNSYSSPSASVPGKITLPLEYPHWGEADLDRQEITLAEWEHFIEL
jgi:ribosomal 30S subunit maturation factor RimM